MLKIKIQEIKLLNHSLLHLQNHFFLVYFRNKYIPLMLKVSFILPCQNEKKALRQSIQEIKNECLKQDIVYEIVVSDSSTDGSDLIAKEEKTKLIKHDTNGYGFAIKQGIKHASYDTIIYADPDGSYDFHEFPKFLKELKENNIVLGNRLNGKISKGAMPFSHRFLGTPLLNLFIRIFFGISIYDSQSGFRVLNKKTFEKLNLVTNNMEFSTEMIIKAKRQGIKITEVPIQYRPRKGNSKLRPYKDGLAHLKYIILETSLITYAIIGGMFFSFGLIGLFLGEKIKGIFNLATVKNLFPIFGLQIIFLGLFSKTYLYTKFKQENEFLKRFYQTFKLKHALFLGFFLIIVPVIFKITGTANDFLNPLLISILIGLQIIFNSFYLANLSIE